MISQAIRQPSSELLAALKLGRPLAALSKSLPASDLYRDDLHELDLDRIIPALS